MRSQTLAAVVVLFLVAPAWVEAKDLILRQRVTITGVRPVTFEMTQYWTADKVVTDSPDSRIIFDLGAQTMTTTQKHQRTYSTETFAEMQQRAEAIKAAWQKQTENLSPEARETAEKQGMGPMVAEGEVSVKPTGKSEKIAGYEAKEYTVVGGKMSGSVWVTDALEAPGGEKEREAFGRMSVPASGSKFTQAITAIKGVPLRTTTRITVGVATGFSSTTEVVEVSEKAPPADVLGVPAGFKKVAAPEFHPGQPSEGAPTQ